MKRRLQLLAICAAALLAMHLMAQDTGGASGGGSGGGETSGGAGGTGGATGPDNSGGTTGPDNSGGMGETPLPTEGAGSQGQGGAGSPTPTPTPGSNELFGPGTEGTGEGSTIVPTSPGATPPPGVATPTPGTTPTPSPTPAGGNAANGGQGTEESAPVTLTLPGGYGGSAPLSFTLGSGRLAKPPITFTASASQGYDTNIFDADSSPVATPTPRPEATPPLEARVVATRINPPSLPTFVFQLFRPKAAPAPTPARPLGVVGSPVSSLTLGAQVQKGSPRTVLTMDLSAGVNDYWNQPGEKTDYTGSYDLAFLHRLTPRASFSLEVSAVYQKTPDFALINAPTNNGNNSGNYLNGSLKADLSYTWTQRISTVTSYALETSLLQSNAGDDLYETTYGTQIRYTVSARNTLTADLRYAETEYPTNATANDSSIYYLVGLDTTFSTRLQNNISAGLEVQSFSGGGASQSIPYLESSTTLGLPRGGALTWTNRYGSEETGSVDETSKSYRTGLTLTQPLSTKLVGSLSVAYNYLLTTDTVTAADSFTQNQLQASASLNYTLSPRFSLSLSYTVTNFMTTQINSSYDRQQITVGGSYTFR
jgi:hypothetical protein